MLRIVTSLRVAACCTGLAAGCASFVGCGTNTHVVPAAPVGAVRGAVHGGQQPVSGATIQLYAVNTTATSGAATALITGTTVTAASDGSFNITGLYSCTSATEVYLVSSGGNPGLSGMVNNSVAVLMAALGPCSSLSNVTYITINEESTAAIVYALQSYMTDSQHVGSESASASFVPQGSYPQTLSYSGSIAAQSFIVLVQ